GLDIYKSEGSDEMFSVGINLGSPINSNRDDFSYIIDQEGTKGYFASNRKGGKGDDDIYSFAYTLNQNEITGTVQQATTGEPIEEAKLTLLDKHGSIVNEALADTEGKYSFRYLDPTSDYSVLAQKDGFEKDSLAVTTKENEKIEVSQYLRELRNTEPEEEVFEPNNVYFDFDSFEITQGSAEELDKLVSVLNKNKELTLKIESHTDAIGPNAYNKYLSDRRAKSTRDYIISKGVDPSRIISAVGYGEERLLNDCANGTPCAPEQHRLNRRSEFYIIQD
ncbi:MAG: OmpA family protein, partial [Bacteroidota bacterium]|nr:OmpA family protein [Bacteroidota bacterium]